MATDAEAGLGRGFHLRLERPAAHTTPLQESPIPDQTLFTRILRDRVAGVIPVDGTRSLLLDRYDVGPPF